MTTADDLSRQANTLAEKLRRARAASPKGGAPDGGELAAMETRLSGLWAAIRAARVSGDVSAGGGATRRNRGKWE
jgi:hypothetical protein